MQNYELLYIIPAQYADTEIDALRAKIAAMVEATGAKVTRNENLGKIKLAYPVKHQRHGTYVLNHLDAEPSMIKEMERQLRLADEVLRHILVERDPRTDRKQYIIASYVAPLSEEARDTRRPGSTGAPMTAAPRAAAPSAEAAQPMRAEEASMSMEELDKKLDEILDKDVAA